MEKDISHMPAASLGHYAALSFVVRGRGNRIGDRSQRKEERHFSVGAAFSRDLESSTIYRVNHFPARPLTTGY
jgi:hypothetical protein